MAAVLAFLVAAWEWAKWVYGLLPLHTWLLIGLCFVCFFAGCSCARGDEPKACPVNVVNCPCGCRSGQQCNCAADKQKAAYFALLKTLKPGQLFYVYVLKEPGSFNGYVPKVRWDSYPGVYAPCVILGEIRADGPYEVSREYTTTVQYRPALLPVFGGRGGC